MWPFALRSSMPRSALFCETFLLNLLLRLCSAILIFIINITFRWKYLINDGKKEREGRRWERIRRGKREYMNARVAQSVERSAVNRKVGGSNPPVSGFLLFLNIPLNYISIHSYHH